MIAIDGGEISQTCQYQPGNQACGKPTAWAYQIGGRGWSGWFALCAEHGEKHKDYAKPIEELVMKGQK